MNGLYRVGFVCVDEFGGFVFDLICDVCVGYWFVGVWVDDLFIIVGYECGLFVEW